MSFIRRHFIDVALVILILIGVARGVAGPASDQAAVAAPRLSYPITADR